MEIGFKPLGRRLLLKQVEAETKTLGGIILPDQNIKRKDEGVVAAISEEIMIVKVGDHVSYREHAGKPFTIEGVEYLLLNEESIEGIFTKK